MKYLRLLQSLLQFLREMLRKEKTLRKMSHVRFNAAKYVKKIQGNLACDIFIVFRGHKHNIYESVEMVFNSILTFKL